MLQSHLRFLGLFTVIAVAGAPSSATASGTLPATTAGAVVNAALAAPISPATTSNTCGPKGSPLLYVANSGNNGSVTIFPAGANGNVAPLRTIAGSNTKLTGGTYGVAHDAQCNVYVSDSNVNAIYKFAAGANGNVAPIATIKGTSTGLAGPAQIAVGPTGTLYVANVGGGSVLEFPLSANGNTAPSTTITSTSKCGDGSGFGSSYGVALDAQQNIYVSNESNNCIAVFAPGAHGSSTPIRTIGGTKSGMDKSYGPYGIAIGPTNKAYLTLFSYYIGSHDLVYAAGANGNVSPLQNIVTSDGGGYGSGYGIAVNSAGNIYISTVFSNKIEVLHPTPPAMRSLWPR